MTPDDPINAILDQLAAHDERLRELDGREAGHHQAVLARLEGLDRQLAELIARLAGVGAADDDSDRYRPGPVPAWWKLSDTERQEPIAHLRAWVEQVYRPGYGYLAATLGPCWEAHDLCLYGLDILSTLWSVLYLQPERTDGLLSAEAEYQARILPALAEQFMAETTRCGHTRNGPPAYGSPPRGPYGPSPHGVAGGGR